MKRVGLPIRVTRVLQHERTAALACGYAAGVSPVVAKQIQLGEARCLARTAIDSDGQVRRYSGSR